MREFFVRLACGAGVLFVVCAPMFLIVGILAMSHSIAYQNGRTYEMRREAERYRHDREERKKEEAERARRNTDPFGNGGNWVENDPGVFIHRTQY